MTRSPLVQHSPPTCMTHRFKERYYAHVLGRAGFFSSSLQKKGHSGELIVDISLNVNRVD